jgi:hypothetical protein
VQKISERAPVAVRPPLPGESGPHRPPDEPGRAAPTCIFCDRAGGSVEFAWPEWLCRFLIRQRDVVTLAQSGRESDALILARMEREVDTTVTRVCETCRDGWMQRLEDDVMPFLQPMIAGEPTSLPATHQWLLARWAAKTAAVLECTLDSPVRTPRVACEHLRKVGVHAGTQVLVGKYDGDLHVLAHERDLFSRTTTDGQQRHFPQATLVIGKVILQVFAGPWRSSIPALVPHAAQPLVPLVGGLGDEIAWPPDVAIGDAQFELARFGVLTGGAAWSDGHARRSEATVAIHD